MSDSDRPSAEAADTTPAASVGQGERSSRTDSWRFREEIPTVHEEDGDIPADPAGKVVANRFRIERVLGQGGMGAVYLAEHTELHKVVALKILHGAMTSNEEVVARFGREAIALGKLAHPCIAAANDFGKLEDGSFYLALEFIDGGSLADLLEKEGPLPPHRSLGIALQVTDALAAAHAEGIVHRDVKPDNVMLVRADDGEDHVKVVDFGIAKVPSDEQEEGLTRAGLVFGTPEYMSPEQAMGHEADERSDLYGVGMLLYEMTTGRSPFRATDVTEMLAAQIKQPAPSLPEGAPPRFSALVARLLEKDPDLRHCTALDLLDDLTELAREEGWMVPAPRTSAGPRPERTREPSSRRRDSTPSGTNEGLGPASTLSGGATSVPALQPRRGVSRWVPFVGLGVGVTIGAAAMLSNTEAVPRQEVTARPQPIDAEGQLVIDASGGDREAISALRKLTVLRQGELAKLGLLPAKDAPAKDAPAKDAPAKDAAARSRTADEKVAEQANRYMVLGRGYSAIKHYSAAIEMYREAVRLDPHLSQDTELLLDVRVAIAARDAVDDGLDFALHQLGSHGADLIYDVYVDYVGKAGMTPVVARALRIAKSDELLAQATPELSIALRLEVAQFCAQFRDIIPDAAKQADERSLPKLMALQETRGCGSDGNGDCFICLRKPDIPLDAAVERARTHPAPTFSNDRPQGP